MGLPRRKPYDFAPRNNAIESKAVEIAALRLRSVRNDVIYMSLPRKTPFCVAIKNTSGTQPVIIGNIVAVAI